MTALLGAALASCSSSADDAGTSAKTSVGNAGTTLTAVRARGRLKCGVSQAAGFATPDDAGTWRGFDADFCRAIAVAVLGDAAKVEFLPFTQQQRFSGLASGEADVLVNGTSQTISRAMGRGFHFGPVYLYDGQGFLAPKKLGVTSAATLDGATVCVQQGTTTELNLADFARRSGITLRSVVIEDLRGAVEALASGRCDVISQDGAGLATTRTMLRAPNDYIVLPERISKEPIAAVVRSGDGQWLEIITWVFHALVEAEELGVTQANAQQQAQGSNPAIQRLLGSDAGVTGGFGLDPRWPLRMVEAVGNYGEIFERSLGPRTPLGMERGMNRLWSDGGLQYAPPFR